MPTAKVVGSPWTASCDAYGGLFSVLSQQTSIPLSSFLPSSLSACVFPFVKSEVRIRRSAAHSAMSFSRPLCPISVSHALLRQRWSNLMSNRSQRKSPLHSLFSFLTRRQDLLAGPECVLPCRGCYWCMPTLMVSPRCPPSTGKLTRRRRCPSAVICHAVRYVLTPIFRGLDFPCFPSRPDGISFDATPFHSTL